MPQRAGDPHPPPRPQRRAHTHHRPTGDVTDPYAWLADPNDPAVLAHLRAENEHTSAHLAHLTELRTDIVDAIRARTNEDDISAATRYGEWFYAAHSSAQSAYPVIRRARDADAARDPNRSEVVLDQNAEAAGCTHSELGAVEPSPDHRLVAWAHDTDGDEHFTLRIRDVATGVDLDDVIHDVAWSGVAWTGDGQHIVYVVPDATERPHRVMAHRLGSDSGEDIIVWTEDDPRFHVAIGATRSGRWIVIHSASKTTTEVHLIDASAPTGDLWCVHPRRDGVDYSVEDWGDQLLILHNIDAPDFALAVCDGPGHDWHPFIDHQPGRRLVAVDPFADFCAVHAWDNAQPQIWLLDRNGDAVGKVDVGDGPHDVEFGANENWDSNQLRVVYQSLAHPATTADVAVGDMTVTTVHQVAVESIDLADYTSRRLWAQAADGTALPIDLFGRCDTPLDGTAPVVCYGYGSYEISLAPWFSTARTVLADQGVLWALLHPRGGGEFGRNWYESGRLHNKQNTFGDVIACVEYLRDSYVDPARIGLRGGSAGGALVGACITQRPELFALGIAEVPFVDVVTTMSDPTLPLTATEWEEWGDPRRVDAAEWIGAWSPYDNTHPAAYPAMFVTAGLHDPRVGYHEPAKWVARLRDMTTSAAPILLRTELDGGHAGPTDRYAAWADEADIIAFTLDVFGLANTGHDTVPTPTR